MMKQITLTEENFVTLLACVDFTYGEEAYNHEFDTGTTEEALDNLKAAIETCTRDVAVDE
jgi:hypothetical protein